MAVVKLTKQITATKLSRKLYEGKIINDLGDKIEVEYEVVQDRNIFIAPVGGTYSIITIDSTNTVSCDKGDYIQSLSPMKSVTLVKNE